MQHVPVGLTALHQRYGGGAADFGDGSAETLIIYVYAHTGGWAGGWG